MKRFVTGILALGLILPALAFSADFKEGTNFKTIKPGVPTEVDDGKIEVVELFWYGCPHCYNMERPIHKWLKTKPDNVVFRRIPALFRNNTPWETHARVFYTAEALGVLDKIHTPFFERIHELKQKMNKVDEIAKFFAEFGVKKDAFDKAWNSFLVRTKVRRSQELTKRYGIDSVPTMVVEGKYVINNSMNGNSSAQTMKVVSYLTKK